MKAKTQVEFAAAWIKSVDALIGCFPRDEDLFKFRLAQGYLKQVILSKAQTLPFPRGDSLRWSEMMADSFEHEETIK